jgi:hypothetical protein
VHAWAFAHDLGAGILTAPDIFEPNASRDANFGSKSSFGIYLSGLVARDFAVGFSAYRRQPSDQIDEGHAEARGSPILDVNHEV